MTLEAVQERLPFLNDEEAGQVASALAFTEPLLHDAVLNTIRLGKAAGDALAVLDAIVGQVLAAGVCPKPDGTVLHRAVLIERDAVRQLAAIAEAIAAELRAALGLPAGDRVLGPPVRELFRTDCS